MRRLLKRGFSFIFVPLTRWYLRKERKYSWRGTTVCVLPGVFHPGLFHSTRFLLDHLSRQDLQNQTLLELGCGAGLISIVAANKGAVVTASDLSRRAIETVTRNAKSNNVSLHIVHTDLFDEIEEKKFDWIIINPPYYAKPVSNESDLAWHCGEDFIYFKKLFASIKRCITTETQVIMVLTQGCDQGEIFQIGAAAGFQFELIKKKNVFFDGRDYLYRISRSEAVID